MKVIGTAGHVDHGKSRLIWALTGINPDRLKEEQDREMTIDLGFAWMELPDGETVGIIDVPGHRDFIDNMLAGVGAIDAALIVIAADEGVMPQTREHLAILDLLDVHRGVVALTKVDLVEDEEWLDLVTDEIRELLAPTRLASAPIVPLSSETGIGLDRLVSVLREVLDESEERKNVGRPRLPIDRVFTISGFGTIVTGTLIDGELSVGQEAVVLPGGQKTRIRGLQTHMQKIETAVPGSRVAANLTGIEVAELERGDVVALPDTYVETQNIEVHYRHLKDAAAKLKHNMQLRLFTGSAQREARVRLLARDELNPRESGWLQLILDKPIVAARGDRFILRRPSPGATLGGGVILEPHPAHLRKRFDERNITRLEKLLQGNTADILAQSLDDLGPVTLRKALVHARIEEGKEEQAIADLIGQKKIIVLSGEATAEFPKTEDVIISRGAWENFALRLRHLLETFHQHSPLRLGMPVEELKAKLNLPARLFPVMLNRAADANVVAIDNDRVSIHGYKVELSKQQETAIDELLHVFEQNPYSTPSVKESSQLIGDDLYRYLIESGTLIQLSKDVVLRSTDFEAFVSEIKQFLEKGNSITVAQVRDKFKTSRKYALAIMEYMDSVGITMRKGDERILAS
jgi:selenocysteine-specific elongation factor